MSLLLTGWWWGGRGGVTAAKGRWSCGGMKVTVKQQVVSGGRSEGSCSVLLRLRLPLMAAHGRDESGSLAAAVLR